MKCGEKWGRQHRCPKEVQLHVLQELMDVLNIEETSGDDTIEDSSDEELLSLSLAVAKGIQGKKMICLLGLINKQERLILVDSGSSKTFSSQAMVENYSVQLKQQQRWL